MNKFILSMITVFTLIGAFIYLEQEISIEEYKSLDKTVTSSGCPSVGEEYKDILTNEGEIDNNNYLYIKDNLEKCEKKDFVKSITKP